MKKVLVAVVVLLSVIVLSGCLEQFWPAEQISPVTVKYVREDPNKYKLPITTLGNIKKMETKIEETHLERQLRLKAEMDTDAGVHSLARAEVQIIRSDAESQYGTIIGTVESPGVLWTVLTALLSGGAMRWITTLTHYSEQEYQAGLAKAGEKNSKS